MSGMDKLNGRVLITFSDVLFDEDLLEKVLRCSNGDINLVIDSSYKERKQYNQLNSVIAKFEPLKGDRVVKCGRKNPIMKIGSFLSSANHEFMGMMLLSAKGTEIFKREYELLLKDAPKGKFYDAGNIEKADINDFIQHLIDKGIEVDSVEVYKGWTEIRSFEDYKRACRMLAE